jgi:hypothetical protein
MTHSKNISLYINGVSPSARTFEGKMADDMERIKHLVCRACELSPKAYDEAHYDLAESWFIYNGYLEYTAKVFMISKIYHRWWNQQIALIEEEFLRHWGNQMIPAAKLREAMFEEIITMEIHPSRELRRQMHDEGAAALRANPDLVHLKIYRNV